MISITINNTDYSANISYPIDVHKTATEELDTATFDLLHTSVSTPFEPFTLASIDGNYMCVGNDVVTKVKGTTKYNHKITLVSLTKMLERHVMEGKSFKQPIDSTYLLNVCPQMMLFGYNLLNSTSVNLNDHESQAFITSMVTSDTIANFDLPQAYAVWLQSNGNVPDSLKYFYIYSKNDLLTYEQIGDEIQSMEETVITRDTENLNFHIPETELEGEGYHYIVLALEHPDIADRWNYTYFQTMYVVSSRLNPPKYTNLDVLNTLAAICCHTKPSVAPYTVGADIYNSAWASATANDIYFNDGSTLLEDLKLIMSTAGAIPKLKYQSNNFVLSWVKLGSNSVDNTFATGKEIDSTESFAASDFATNIESKASNMVNNDNGVKFPCDGKKITFRASDILIKEGTGKIILPFPAYTVTKLVCKHNATTYDLTKYLFENDAYEGLSSYSGVYPFTKCYALRYQKGSNVIDGFWYRNDDDDLSSWISFQNYAIKNIFSLLGVTINQTSYSKLLFNVEYVPFIDAKVRQYKVDAVGMNASTQVFNQSARVLNAKEYGNKLRGQVAKMGTTNTSKIMLYNGNTVPTPGWIAYDNEYITEVYSRMYPTYNISQVVLTTNFNGLGSYVEIPQEERQYEISKAMDRFSIYEAFVDVCDTSVDYPTNGFISKYFQTMICDSLKKLTTSKMVDRMFFQTYDEDGAEIGRFVLPAYSTPLGTSVLMTAKCKDNISVGDKSALVDTITNVEKRVLQSVNYGDSLYGKFRTLKFQFSDDGGSLAEVIFANNFPSTGTKLTNDQTIFGTIGSSIDYRKDSSDTLNITAQVHFVSSKGWFISDNLAKIMRCVGGLATGNLVVRTYNAKVNRLTLDEPTTHSDQLTTTTGMILGEATFVTINEIPTNTYQSWILGFANGSNFMPLVAGNGIVPLNTCFNLKNNI